MKLKKLVKVLSPATPVGVGNEFGDYLGEYKACNLCGKFGENSKVLKLWKSSTINITIRQIGYK